MNEKKLYRKPRVLVTLFLVTLMCFPQGGLSQGVLSPYLFASCHGISTKNKLYLIIILKFQNLAPRSHFNVAYWKLNSAPPCVGISIQIFIT